MSILKRITNILEANIQTLLDKAEDPEKMIEQYLRQAVEDLEEVKKETAGIMAEESRARRVYDENIAEVEKYLDLAKKALAASNEADAKVFIDKKQQLEQNGESLKKMYELAKSNAVKMRKMHDKLIEDIDILHSKRDELKAKLKIAETQEIANNIASSANDAKSTLNDFARMEDKINQMLDVADATAQLEGDLQHEAETLEEKYDTDNTSVDKELSDLKKSMGL